MGETKHTSFRRILPYLIVFLLSIKAVSNFFTYYKAISILRHCTMVTHIIIRAKYFRSNVNKNNRNFVNKNNRNFQTIRYWLKGTLMSDFVSFCTNILITKYCSVTYAHFLFFKWNFQMQLNIDIAIFLFTSISWAAFVFYSIPYQSTRIEF